MTMAEAGRKGGQVRSEAKRRAARERAAKRMGQPDVQPCTTCVMPPGPAPAPQGYPRPVIVAAKPKDGGQ